MRSVMFLAAGVLCATCLWGCNSVRTPTSPETTSPTTPTTPTPPAAPVSPASVRYHLSGRVTDETGARIPGVLVEVDYAKSGGQSTPLSNCPFNGNFCWLVTRTDADGFYEVELEAGPYPQLPGAFGYIYTVGGDGYESDVQTLPAGPTPMTKNLRAPRVRRIDAGQSMKVSLAPDSAFCWYDDYVDWTRRCEIVRVTAGMAGTLSIEARATGGGVVPSIILGQYGNYVGSPVSTTPGTVSAPVQAGTSLVFIAVPSGTVQAFDVSTSLR